MMGEPRASKMVRKPETAAEKVSMRMSPLWKDQVSCSSDSVRASLNLRLIGEKGVSMVESISPETENSAGVLVELEELAVGEVRVVVVIAALDIVARGEDKRNKRRWVQGVGGGRSPCGR
ncbi:unnamed protein product [Chondrus crispus]|uniref:Uncharacterized protein n=1 Tax=Chondrus crispus TaxID=2769 RepID=R7Q3P9_CHOCR|nr:unnamed protein product [Chondrus crispus]CDF32105.1 unnamed protein product [Chondrus crispus]|eukprot:XP_005711770.1 unnamed protein product [Chondrus crispus]